MATNCNNIDYISKYIDDVIAIHENDPGTYASLYDAFISNPFRTYANPSTGLANCCPECSDGYVLHFDMITLADLLTANSLTFSNCCFNYITHVDVYSDVAAFLTKTVSNVCCNNFSKCAPELVELIQTYVFPATTFKPTIYELGTYLGDSYVCKLVEKLKTSNYSAAYIRDILRVIGVQGFRVFCADANSVTVSLLY